MKNKIKDYIYIENKFYNYIKEKAPDTSFEKMNLCNNNENERIFLMELAETLKKKNPFYAYKHLYIVVLFLYYGLVLSEQTEDYLHFTIIKNITSNYVNVTNLIIEIASSDKEYAQKIRRLFFKMEKIK